MIRIAITGPESTGKSWLTSQLAAFYNAPFVIEYSREYLEALQRPYTYDDILNIAKGQLKLENEAARNSCANVLFADTDQLVNYIWCKVKYNKVHPWIADTMVTHRYQHYLLCDIDLPWESDPLREHPHRREEIFELYVKTLELNGLPYTIIQGNGELRFFNAIAAVNKILNPAH
ncbi:hypothetical protein MASR1M74_04330 [Lentimicrobium sp.]